MLCGVFIPHQLIEYVQIW